jgi:hypothetical protein
MKWSTRCNENSAASERDEYISERLRLTFARDAA